MMTDVTDRPDLLTGPHGWKVVLAAGVAVLTAASVTVAFRASDPAAADTFVTGAHNAAVQPPGGQAHSAVVGERVPAGATVLTGDGGSAELSTAGRDVYVGALSTVRIQDGVHQRLDRGLVMVDSRRGARLDLVTPAGEVRTPSGVLTRVEDAAQLRLAVYGGHAAFAAAGRSSTAVVPGLHQVQVPYGQLPGRVTALALTPGDPWEARLVADLVAADADLNHLAYSLDGNDGATVLNAAPAALRTTPPPPGPLRSETALSVALAQAARGDDPVTTLATVETSRREGGSWGVVAAIVGARVTGVSALLDGTLAPLPGAAGSVAAGVAPSLSGLLGSGGAGTGGSVGGSGSGSDGTAPRQPTPSSPSGAPSTAPAPLPSPTPTAVVDQLVTTVLSVVPTPVPTTSPAPAPAPSPTSSTLLPSLQLPPLLGIQLG
jgi:hypothetical protein